MTTPDIAGLCERLRVMVHWLDDHDEQFVTEAADTLERQDAEIKRLRTGLEKVAAYYGPSHRITEIARAALTGEDT